MTEYCALGKIFVNNSPSPSSFLNNVLLVIGIGIHPIHFKRFQNKTEQVSVKLQNRTAYK